MRFHRAMRMLIISVISMGAGRYAVGGQDWLVCGGARAATIGTQWPIAN